MLLVTGRERVIARTHCVGVPEIAVTPVDANFASARVLEDLFCTDDRISLCLMMGAGPGRAGRLDVPAAPLTRYYVTLTLSHLLHFICVRKDSSLGRIAPNRTASDYMSSESAWPALYISLCTLKA